MLKRESYRKNSSPFNSISPLLDSEFDDLMNESWTHNIAQPKYREVISRCSMADLIS